MTRADFLYLLRRGLEGLPEHQIKELVADCESHFEEGMAQGRSEEEIAAALGDPSRLARELRAEAGFKRWEAEGTPRSFAGVVLALLGLATVDVMVLFPFLCTLGAIFLVIGVVAVALFIAGVVILVISPFPGVAGLGLAGGLTDMLALALAGLGLAAGGVGVGALFWWAAEAIARLLVRYARLHFRLIDSVSI